MFDFFFRSYWPDFWSRYQDSLLGSSIDSDRDAVPAHSAAEGPSAQPSEPGLPIAEREFSIGPAVIPGLAGFRIDSEDVVPGFNVRPPDSVPGFHPDEDDVDQQDTTWSLDTLDPPSDAHDEPRAPELPQFPEWLYAAAAIPPPSLTSIAPAGGHRLSISPTPALPPGGSQQWQTSGLPPMPAVISSRGPTATVQGMNSRPATAEVPLSPWPTVYGGLHTQVVRGPSSLVAPSLWEPASEPSTPSVRPLAVATAIRETMGDAGARSGPKPFSPLHHAPTQQPASSAPLGSSRTVSLADGLRATHGAQQESTRLGEVIRQLREADARRRLVSIRTPSTPSSLAANRYSPDASVPAEQSWAQNLVQSSIDTIVPGAHYQKLAQQQLDAGNYLGAGVYEVAALLDAALGTATFGLSTRATAAARATAREGADLFRRVFESKSQLLGHIGKAPKDMQWHHIVEQSQAIQFGQQRIQSIENIVALPIDAHRKISGFYSSKQLFSGTNTVRSWLRGKSFEEQYDFGMTQIRRILGY